MPRRYFSSTAVTTTLASQTTNSATTMTVTALTGYPAQTPWTAIIDEGTASEEVVTVTNVAGTTLTVTRGVDGTSGVSHNAGATFKHGVSARDFDEPNDHVNASSDSVHSQFVPKSVVDAAGDLIVGSGSDAVGRVALGSNGHVLTVDTSGSGVAKVKWAANPAPHATAAARTTVTGLSVAPSDSISSLATINWPSGRFSVEPVVLVTNNDDSNAAGSYRAIYTADSSSGSSTIYFSNANSSTTITKLSVNVVAVQMTSGSATG